MYLPACRVAEQPLAAAHVVPFKVHGIMEIPVIPSMLILPWATGAMKQPKARYLFFAMFGLALTSFLLTDFNAHQNGRNDLR